MRKVICGLAMASMCVCLSGCGQQPYQNTYNNIQNNQRPMYEATEYIVDLKDAKYSDKIIEASIEPVKLDSNYKYFTLTIKNNSNKDLKLSWNDSYFIENGSANGGFMFEGVKYVDRNNPKQDLLILGKSTKTIDILPCAKVLYLEYNAQAARMGLPTGWSHAVLKDGVFGAYLSIKGAGYSKEVKLLVGLETK